MKTNPKFCVGVQIILKRMESNPEEFNVSSGNYGKWGRVLEQIVLAKEAGNDKLPFPNHLNGLTAAEKNAIYDGYCKFLRKRFDDYVMKEILADAEELSYSVTSAPPTVLSHGGAGNYLWANGGAGAVSGTITTNINQHQAHVNKHMAVLHTLGLKETI
jgi:hypothetical protein